MFGTLWTAADDAILLSVASNTVAAKLLGKTREACVTRRRRLSIGATRLRRAWTAEEDAILLAAPSLTAAALMINRSRGACSDRRIKLQPERKAEPPQEDFLSALRRHETPPTDVRVRGRQPLMHNPSLYQGSGCSSSAAMD